jgi:hypothetical protein
MEVTTFSSSIAFFLTNFVEVFYTPLNSPSTFNMITFNVSVFGEHPEIRLG